MRVAWQYVLIFLGVVIEGPAVTLTAAALAGSGLLDPYVVFLSAGTGNVTGDLFWYLLGYLGRIETLMAWFPMLTPLQPQIDRLKIAVAQRASRMLLIAKLAFGVASIPTLVAAGIARVPWPRVLLTQIVGEVIWSGALVLFGLFLGQYVSQLQKDIRIAAFITGLLFVFLAIWLIRRYIKIGN
jgi:membrane protein DedA with SNARE-associated domain